MDSANQAFDNINETEARINFNKEQFEKMKILNEGQLLIHY